MRSSIFMITRRVSVAVGVGITVLALSAVDLVQANGPQITPQCGPPEIPGATLFAACQVQPPIELGHCFKEYRVRSDMHCISSGRFGAGVTQSLEHFLSRSEQDVRDGIRYHIETQLGWTNGEELTYTGLVVADIEHEAHPNRIKEFATLGLLDQVAEQWSLCIRVLSEEFPCAEIGWAPIYTPPINGHTTPDPLRVQLMGYVLGFFDFSDLDYIAPIVYPRLWVGDQVGSQPPLATAQAVRDRYVDIATNAASTMAAFIAEADTYDPTFSSHAKPMVFFGYRIYNGNSNWDGRFMIEPQLDQTLEYTIIPQVDVFENSGIYHFTFWSGSPELANLEQGIPVHVNDYWRLLSCEFDYDGDGQRNFFDFTEWMNYYSNNGLCADLTGDGVVDIADFNHATNMAGAGACN